MEEKSTLSKTQVKIIDSALSLLAENGYKATTTKEIAKTAEVNETTIFKNFENKKNLFIFAFERNITTMMNEITILVQEKFSTYEQYLQKIIKETFEIMLRYQTVITITLREIGNKELDVNQNSVFERLTNMFAERLALHLNMQSEDFITPMYMLVSSLFFTVINEKNGNVLIDDLQSPITIEKLTKQTINMVSATINNEEIK